MSDSSTIDNTWRSAVNTGLFKGDWHLHTKVFGLGNGCQSLQNILDCEPPPRVHSQHATYEAVQALVLAIFTWDTVVAVYYPIECKKIQ